MRTTIDLPDTLFKQMKSQAALEGLKLREFVEDALRHRLAGGARVGADPVPVVTVADLSVFSDPSALRRAYPLGYRLSVPCLAHPSPGRRLRQVDVDGALRVMEEQEDQANASVD